MKYVLNIPSRGALDFLALGALVHRLDPGIIPFRKATQCQIHVSGGEFNTAANLADCFGLRTGIATAMVDYPIGDLIAERVRAMGVQPFYRRLTNELLLRQKEIETRLLEVEKSLREQEQDDKRSSRTAVDISRPIPPALQKYITDQRQLLELYKTVPPQLKPYYREMVESYFHIIGNK